MTWTFTDPAGIINQTGGSGGYAGINSDYGQPGVPEDTALVSPVADLTTVAKPVLVWDTHYTNGGTSRSYADITTDRGRSWQTVWSITDLSQQLPGPADQSWYWQVDNVILGHYGCVPTAGGRSPDTSPTATPACGSTTPSSQAWTSPRSGPGSSSWVVSCPATTPAARTPPARTPTAPGFVADPHVLAARRGSARK